MYTNTKKTFGKIFLSLLFVVGSFGFGGGAKADLEYLADSYVYSSKLSDTFSHGTSFVSDIDYSSVYFSFLCHRTGFPQPVYANLVSDSGGTVYTSDVDFSGCSESDFSSNGSYGFLNTFFDVSLTAGQSYEIYFTTSQPYDNGDFVDSVNILNSDDFNASIEYIYKYNNRDKSNHYYDLNFKISSSSFLSEFPTCTANQDTRKIECEDWGEGIDYFIDTNENGDLTYLLTPETVFSGGDTVYVSWTGADSYNLEPLVFEPDPEWIFVGKTWSEIQSFISSPDLSSSYIFTSVLNFNYQKTLPLGVPSSFWNQNQGFFSSGLSDMDSSITSYIGSDNEFWSWHLQNGGGFIPTSCVFDISFSGISENVYLDTFEVSSLASSFLDPNDSSFQEGYILGFFSNEDSQYYTFFDEVFYNKNIDSYEIENVESFFAPRTQENNPFKLGENGIQNISVFLPACASSVYDDVFTSGSIENNYFNSAFFTASLLYKEDDVFLSSSDSQNTIFTSDLSQNDLFDCGGLANSIASRNENPEIESDTFFGSWYEGVVSRVEYFTDNIGGGVLYGSCVLTDYTLTSMVSVFDTSSDFLLDTLGITDFIYSFFPSSGSEICLKEGSEEVPFCAVYRWREEWADEVPFTRMFLVGLFFFYLYWRMRKFFNSK